MTKVQVRFRLRAPLDEAMLARIWEAHAIYGITRIEVAGSREEIMVEYDATRLRVQEVESALAGAGLAVEVLPPN